ncbi:MAG: chondroitinase-B domain-containing protein [candidate division KSB1 bacterium]|nr:chondroitinase-B domain-containing protein [candidate division KSB1 bacterium]
MYRFLVPCGIAILLMNCGNFSNTNKSIVSNPQELQNAIQKAEAGDEIVLSNGIWENVQIHFYGTGTEDKPIKLRAESPGQVSIEGQSCLKIGGEYLVIDGLYFKNGYTPNNTVIDFRINQDSIANHCRITNCVIEDFTQPNRFNADHWVEFWGRHNQLDHCYLAGKFNQGPTIRIFLSGNEHIRNYHQIINNHFGPRPRKGGPRAETMQIGDSFTSMTPSYVNVASNLFERCNGEVEVISSKSNFNEFRNNIFLVCEGSLVMRHGNYCIVDGNFFIGSDKSQFAGGIRVINTGHWITNNYFYKLKGDEFRGPLAIMNGIPKSPLNRYNQVTDVVVAHNSWIDCESPWHISVGANMNKRDVLPASEIRSARPKRVVIANNLIYNHQADDQPLKNYDKVDGVLFKNNIIDNQKGEFKYNGLEQQEVSLEKTSEWLFVPSADQNDALESVYTGFGFEDIQTDIFGNARTDKNRVGAIAGSAANSIASFDKSKYGAQWFSPTSSVSATQTIDVTPEQNMSQIIGESSSGDILELSEGIYQIEKSLPIDKKITIRAKSKSDKVSMIYSGAQNSPLFEMYPKGNLILDHISITGKRDQFAIATLERNMSFAYNIHVSDCQIHNFSHILKACKGSFADSISISNSIMKNCINGLELAAETDDRGDYNAEFVTITHCTFENIQKNVINFYRGGYDESTIGGNLLVENCLFKKCGVKEKSKILLKTRGIIHVNISNNSFQNNPVVLVALLWGEKNNHHGGNQFTKSGIIRVDQYLKQKLVY